MCTLLARRAFRFYYYGILLWSMGFTPLLSAQTAQEPAAFQTQAFTVFPPALSIYAQPVFAVPLIDSANYFGLGGGLGLGIEYGSRGNPQFFLGGLLDYAFLPVKDETSSVSLLSALAGAGAYFWFTPRLGVKVTGQGGYHVGFLNDSGSSSGNLALQGGVSLEYLLVPALNVSLGAAYRYDLGTFQGLAVTVATSLFLRGTEGRRLAIAESQRRRVAVEGPKKPEKGRGIELANLELYEIFPVFHKFYDDHPVGMVTLVNKEKTAITDVKLSFLIKQYMDSPKDCPAPADLTPGARQDVPIMSLLTERVLEVTEATKVAADLTLEYRMQGQQYRDTRTVTVRVLDRNAMTWEDDRRAAAFVTAKDPAVLTFAKVMTGPLRDKGPEAIDTNLLTACGLFTALDLYGLSYVVDPKTPFTEYSSNKSQVDFLQFPRQTLEYKAGDCDDLSILCAALLESVGIETAFITVPGHIYVAFATGLSPEEAHRTLSTTGDLIEQDNVVWVPVEVTERRGGFLKAWATGAKEWRAGQAEGTAAFVKLHDAWKQYEPVGLPGAGIEFAPPTGDALLAAFRREVARFIERETAPRVARLQEEIRKSEGSPAARNKLGVLYAQYGRYAQAEAEFNQTVSKQEYVPALINLGNLFVLQGQPKRAQEFYERAAQQEPQNPKVLVGLAKTYNATEQYERAKAKLEVLAAVDRGMAERYAYLGAGADTTGRAGSADTMQQKVLWAE